MIHEWRTPLPVRTPKGDGDCLAVIDYGYNVNTVWLCRMHGTGRVLHFDAADVEVYGNPMDGRGWDVTDAKPASPAAKPAKDAGEMTWAEIAEGFENLNKSAANDRPPEHVRDCPYVQVPVEMRDEARSDICRRCGKPKGEHVRFKDTAAMTRGGAV